MKIIRKIVFVFWTEKQRLALHSLVTKKRISLTTYTSTEIAKTVFVKFSAKR